MPLPKYQESLFVTIDSMDGVTHQLHLKHLWRDADAPVVVMFHGIIENGRIFYKDTDKGLGNFLVDNGFQVYIADFRGRGLSHPAVSQHHQFGQHETIVEDIPAVMAFLHQKHQQPLHVICHSYGGVLFSSALVRHQGFVGKVASLTCFGTKRRVQAPTLDRWFKVSLVWNRIVPLLARRRGFFDAKQYGIGDDAESWRFIQDSIAWIRTAHWVDPHDGFDYRQAAQATRWPACWYFSAKKDYSLGHHQDVQRFIDECQHSDYRHHFLSVQSGNLRDYDHINMLTHSSATRDHFPELVKWMQQQIPVLAQDT